MQIAVRVSGYNAEGARFAEDTNTIEIASSGCSVTLKQAVRIGQRLVLRNQKTNITVECMVAHVSSTATQPHVGLAFVTAVKSLWPIVFPPSDWSGRDPEAKRSDKP